MASNVEEDMDIDNVDSKFPVPKQAPHSADDNETSTPPQPIQVDDSEDTDISVATLKVRVTPPELAEPKKFKNTLTKTLQSWANKNGVKGEFTATEISADGATAVISVTPAAALSELLTLGGKTLATKDQKNFSITPIVENDVPQTPPVKQKSVKSPQDLSDEHLVNSPADDNSDNHLVALGPYWYMKNFHADKIECIERQNGVKITENVAVSIKADKKDADLQKASDDFIKLVQSCLNESSGIVLPLKAVGPEEWKETLNILQSTDEKYQITISDNQIKIVGPQQTAIYKSLKRTKISTNLTDEKRIDDHRRGNAKVYTNSHSEDRSYPNRNKIKINSSIKDPFVCDGLPVEEYYWDLIKKQYPKELGRIETKFNVCFKDADSKGQKVIKVYYNRSEGNVQMESHAIRALLRLYQKVATSLFLKNNGAFHDGDDDDVEDLYSASDEPKGATGKNDAPDEKSSTNGLTEGGAVKKQFDAEAKKDEKDDTCPVCLDTFTKKTQLKSCKHEFCEECLERSVKTQGAICPVCKDVFGKVEGDQPHGNMTWRKSRSSIPGYEGFGSIEISYDIPSGIQTAKHPSPGQWYSGINRTAYLPDNREGNEVLFLLRKAFDQKLIFTVGTSRTTGANNMVTWNDIHHKTSIYGGPQSFGYPDPNYLSRVKEELKMQTTHNSLLLT
ncbi:uncharacterized protein LOC110171288 isoform X2 [Boleophthalmus pectinirostris]|uniref:uncharacterized protein LOC110171288 isoform X2 n=1 Tax=Boleophthalmus pectinirostris TaxID=150288 RepID=UPI00242E5ACE|nr:uncharacterized protein LOC110171288 isoform X2 [Boleophthalmus pectinirostris]